MADKENSTSLSEEQKAAAAAEKAAKAQEAKEKAATEKAAAEAKKKAEAEKSSKSKFELEVEKIAKEYAPHYPGDKALHFTTDKMVFLEKDIAEAQAHQVQLGKGKVVTIKINA